MDARTGIGDGLPPRIRLFVVCGGSRYGLTGIVAVLFPLSMGLEGRGMRDAGDLVWGVHLRWWLWQFPGVAFRCEKENENETETKRGLHEVVAVSVLPPKSK